MTVCMIIPQHTWIIIIYCVDVGQIVLIRRQIWYNRYDNNNLKETSNGTQWYIGSNAVREYNYYFTDNSYDRIPIENNGGGGTANVHLEEGDEGTVSSNNRYYNGVLHEILFDTI